MRRSIVIPTTDPLRIAFYNVTMLLFAVCCVLSLVGSYFLFYDFVKPALWAVICGIVLYPLKRLMTTIVKNYLDFLSNTDTPLLIGLPIMPIMFVTAVGDRMLDVLIKRRYIVGTLFCSIPIFLLVVRHKLVPKFIMVIQRITAATDFFLLGFKSRWVLLPLIIYMLAIFALSFSEESRYQNHITLLRHPLISAVFWLLAVSHLCSYLGPLRSTGFIFTIFLYITYWYDEIVEFWDTSCGWLSPIISILSPNIRQAISSTWQLTGDAISYIYDTILPAIQNKSNQVLAKLERPPRTGHLSAGGSNSKRLSRSTSKQSEPKISSEDRTDGQENLVYFDEDIYQEEGADVSEDRVLFKEFADADERPTEEQATQDDIIRIGFHSDGENGRSLKVDIREEAEDSNRYIKYLLLACLFVYMSTRLHLLSILLVPISFAFLKRVAYALQIHLIIQKLFLRLLDQCSTDSDILVPGPIRSLWFYLVQLDKKLISFMKSSVDVVGSLAALVIMLTFITFVFIFLAAQLYYESMHIVTLSSELAKHMMEHNARFRQWIVSRASAYNVSSITELVQTQAHRLYVDYGKAWIFAKIKHLVNDNETQAKVIETQMKTLVLTVYASFNGTSNETEAHGTDDEGFDLSDLLDITSAGDILDIIYANFVTLYEVLNTMWGLLVQNAELIYGSIGGLLSTLLESGTAVMDFIINTTVFLTILFGLLTSSGQQFKPLETLQYLSPSRRSANAISQDIGEAVSGIFLATLKMALFYGFFTWLTHTIFAVNLIFIPSILAAIFAAIPLFGPSFVAIPAMIELWLIRGEPLLALSLFVIHNIPGYFVDDAIYSGIKFCDPFLTGIAIAGGMLWWGLEGAIFGPIMLCIYQVIFSIYENIIATKMRQDFSEISRRSSAAAIIDIA